MELKDVAESKQIYESYNSIVYRGIWDKIGQPVIIKILKAEYPTLNQIERYHQEFYLTHNLNIEGVIKAYELRNYGRSYAIIFEDFGAVSLKEIYDDKVIELEDFFKIGVSLCEILGKVHSVKIIHKDINPGNIVYNRQTQTLKLIDFGIATGLDQEYLNPNTLEGTLPYISPEQTGRMNRVLDYRSDFYSLGVTFYELLTGQLPFQVTEPLEILYCHLAKQPVSPEEINPGIPPILAKIIMKLMAKNADDRYQSSQGIEEDLKTCWRLWKDEGKNIDFAIAQQDYRKFFQISQKLYGREAQRETLLESFEKVSRGKKELILVSGYSGIGKTSLIREIYHPITRHKGYFISGKFDQFKKNIPYGAWLEAGEDLLKQLLTETQEKIEIWSNKILDRLGYDLIYLVQVLPDIKLILGDSKAIPSLPSSDYQVDFDKVLLSFLAIFSAPDYPLVIFLDDLQWADVASLKFIQLLMGYANINYLFLISAYRDNEVDGLHPLSLTIGEIKKNGYQPLMLQLSPLDIEQVNLLIADTLKQSPESIEELGKLCFRKTQGNPLFINQFLKWLYKESLLTYRVEEKRWCWDIEKIKLAPSTDNVIDLMMYQMGKLSLAYQNILQIAACIGNVFELNTVAIVAEKSLRESVEIVWDLVGEGFIIPLDRNYQLYRNNSPTETVEARFKFIHDRIQQSAYSLIPETERGRLHLKIARLLAGYLSREQQDRDIFKLVNHFNQAQKLLTTETDREEIARLNLKAGQKARIAAAYQEADDYLTRGLSLLHCQSWQDNYELSLDLYTEAGEVAYLCGDFARMENLTGTVIEKARHLLDKAIAYEIRIAAYMAQYDLGRVVDTGLTVLSLLGLNLPRNPNLFHVLVAVCQTTIVRLGKPISSLARLRKMENPHQQAVMRILNMVVSATYMVNPLLFLIFISKGVYLSIKQGIDLFSPGFYSAYGLILCGLVGDIPQGYKFGNLATTLVESYPLQPNKNTARVRVVVNYFIRSWRDPYRQLLSPLLMGYSEGMQTGEIEYAFYGLMGYTWLSLFSGVELPLIADETTKYAEVIDQYKRGRSFYFIELNRQFCLNLLSIADKTISFDIDIFDEETGKFVNLETTDRSFSFHYYFCKMWLLYLFKDYRQAEKMSRLAAKYRDSVIAKPTYAIYHFMDSLNKIRLIPSSSPLQRLKLYLQIWWNQRRLKKWARHAECNFLHKYYLVEAEIARIRRCPYQAQNYYEKAIKEANDNQFLHEEALAYELAGRFYLESGRHLIAKSYLQEAHYCYSRWGAKAKVKEMETSYSNLISSFSSPASPTIHTSLTSGETGKIFDVATIMKAYQAIAEELVLEKLLRNLMQMMITNAGAQRGFLLLESQGGLSIEAEGDKSSNSFPVLQSGALETRLPLSLINYVSNSRTSVILDDASQENIFANDEYIQNHEIKSILCTPLINGGKLKGLVYLENNLTRGAFNSERLELIQILSAQAAIAIENAQLYNNLENKVKERTEKLSSALDSLKLAQEELIQSEKLAALGQLIAGIAHEVNNPLAIINSSAHNIKGFLSENFTPFLQFFCDLEPIYRQSILDLIESHQASLSPLSTREERALKRSLAEKLSDYGIESNDYLIKALIKLGIYKDIDRWKDLILSPQGEKIFKMMAEIADSTASIANIMSAADKANKVVFALKTYAHQQEESHPAEMDIIASIETVLTLYQSLLKRGVTLVRDYQNDLPKITGYVDQLNQVWTNLIYNALQAMNFQGVLEIKVRVRGSEVEIKIIDNGVGIAPEIMPRIFEPFFTTKPTGEGSGLGLHIVRQIIDKHKGRIEVFSASKQTIFIVYLPL